MPCSAVADEVVLGTAAIEDPGFLRTASARHPGRVIASLDLRDGRVALDGWSRVGGDEADELRGDCSMTARRGSS
jgi:phosphoribosylformimino-5-aminoimidazole carboxamide ribotide isomerase